jgi:hypothetical protein
MEGQFVVLKDPRDDVLNRRYRARLYKNNLYTYEWQDESNGKTRGWYLLNTVVRNPDPKALDTTAYYAE